MSAIREVLFNLLLNAFLQIALFAIVAAAFSRLVAQAKARYQYSFYLSVLVLCLVLPAVNTLWHAQPFAFADKFSQDVLHETSSPGQDFWIWKGHPKVRHRLAPAAETEDVLLAIWAALILYQLIHFGRGLRRVHRLRNDARLLSRAEIGAADHSLARNGWLCSHRQILRVR